MKVLLIKVSGIHCGSCIGRIEHACKLQGAKDVIFNLSEKEVKVVYEDGKYQKYIDAINELGYLAIFKVQYDEKEIL